MSWKSDHWSMAELMLSAGFVSVPPHVPSSNAREPSIPRSEYGHKRERVGAQLYHPPVTPEPLQPVYETPPKPRTPSVKKTAAPLVKPQVKKTASASASASAPAERCTICGKRVGNNVCLSCKSHACSACFTTFMGLCHKCYRKR